jgi:hypothetical protein
MKPDDFSGIVTYYSDVVNGAALTLTYGEI